MEKVFSRHATFERVDRAEYLAAVVSRDSYRSDRPSTLAVVQLMRACNVRRTIGQINSSLGVLCEVLEKVPFERDDLVRRTALGGDLLSDVDVVAIPIEPAVSVARRAFRRFWPRGHDDAGIDSAGQRHRRSGPCGEIFRHHLSDVDLELSIKGLVVKERLPFP